MPSKPARWGQERRLEFIDFKLYWEGRVNRSDLMDFFGISVPQASLDLARYQEIAPNNISYDKTQKAYLSTPEFSPILTSKPADGFLRQLLALQLEIIQPNSSFVGWLPPMDAVRNPTRTVDVEILRLTMKAIREKRTLRISYQSMTHSDPSERVISPHAIAFDGFRWHIRAFSHDNREFRDFVFARILSMVREEKEFVDSSADMAWHKQIEVVVVPNSTLTEGQRRAVELDFEMSEGKLVLRTREALLFYLLKHLGLLPESNKTAASQYCVLANPDHLKEFFASHDLIFPGNDTNDQIS